MSLEHATDAQKAALSWAINSRACESLALHLYYILSTLSLFNPRKPKMFRKLVCKFIPNPQKSFYADLPVGDEYVNGSR